MMTIFDEITEALACDPEIKLLYGSLSAGDRSILSLLLENDAGVGTTIHGSPNAQFWHCLSEYGWMTEASEQVASVQILQYRLTDRGYRAVPALLSRLTPPESCD
ncbi:MAG: hypothetical protein V4512_14850 [Pseudomonadota bacterium]